MRKLRRERLGAAAQAFLEERTRRVLASADRKSEMQRLWDARSHQVFDEIRSTLKAMASGLERCMYCEDSAGTDIEHFWPKSLYPERAFSWENHLLACSGCNSNYKRDQFPLDEAGRPLLIEPTTEDPREHLDLSSKTGRFEARTIKGQKSIEVFGLSRDALEKGRKSAWRIISLLLLHYGEACSRNDSRTALCIQQDLCQYPFASVFVWLLDVAARPDAATFIDERCLAVLDEYPDIKGWL
jgi:uncharacterized protein (TIGR02646 family)